MMNVAPEQPPVVSRSATSALQSLPDPAAAIARAQRLVGDLEAMLVPGAGHLPGMQVPHLVNARVEDFIARQFPVAVRAG